MLFPTQIERITLAKNKAFKVFHDTKKKFESAIQEADEYINQNEIVMEEMKAELDEKADVNFVLRENITNMKKTIDEINKFIGA